MGNDTRQLPQAVIDAIAARLSALSILRLPAQLSQGATFEQKQDYLRKLLLHDPGVFLERHGSSLSKNERGEFEGLRGDYEVDFYLKLLEDQEDEHKRGATAKNRRLAFMNRLVAEGSYFSEKEMRERQPGLYHQYVGQYRPPEQPQVGEGCQAGAILAESIMRQQDELDMRQRQVAEQVGWDRQEAAAALRESEEESESEEEGVENGRSTAGRAASGWQQQQQQQAQQQHAMGGSGGAAAAAHAAAAGQGAQRGAEQAGAGAGTGAGTGARGAAGAGADVVDAGEDAAYVHIPEEERAEYAAAFLDAMQQRFLSGQDADFDYAAIDADAELDEDWAVQQGRDAEDKYFDEDED